MITIKFRGQAIDKQWFYGDLIQISGGALIYHGEKQTVDVISQKDSPCAVGFYPHEISPVEPNTVGQFTGLTDKNGVDIYEGDILEGFEYPVTFEDGCFCATIQYDLVRCWLNSENCNLENLEVIGNAHDNPELLR